MKNVNSFTVGVWSGETVKGSQTRNVPDTSSLTSFTIPFNGTTGNDIIVELTPVTGQTPEIEGVSIEVCYTPVTTIAPTTVSPTTSVTPPTISPTTSTTTPCAETMIAEGSNTNAIKVVIPTLVSPANVFSATGVTLTDAVPTVEFVLLDQDQAAAVSILTFDTTNVSGVKVTLFDKSDAEVKTTESNPVNNKVSVDLGGSVGQRIKIELTKSTSTQTASIASLTIKACIEIVSATTVVTLPTTTFPTTTPKICVFNKDVFVNNFGYEPAEVIGYVNKDNDDSVISESEKIRVGDSLDDGVIVVINGCSNCSCSDGYINCQIGTCEECTYQPWSEWSQCSKPCGIGLRERTRILTTTLSPDRCKEAVRETEDCNIEPCPTTTTQICEPWSTWSECAGEKCKDKTKTRSRTCPNGPDTEEEPCFVEDDCKPECIEPEYFDNCTTPSTHCPSTCRALRNPGSCVEPEECKPVCRCKPGYVRDDNGICIPEEECPCYHNGQAVPEGHVVKTSACETCKCENKVMTCSVNASCCEYSEWQPWSECSTTCGIGMQSRYRDVSKGDRAQCPDVHETKQCESTSTECVQCIYNGKAYAAGDVVSTADCKICYCYNGGSVSCVADDAQNVNGSWSNWQSWISCSSTCSGGHRKRSRTCNNPAPVCAGMPCSGSNEETEPCNTDKSCCITTSWGEWTECTKTCDGPGQQFRNRNYVNPDDSAVNCNETLVEERPCGEEPCITECEISQWSDWTECAVPCGKGKVSRERQIIESAPDCPTNLFEEKDCDNGNCTCPDGQVWTNYSLCQRTCATRDKNIDEECSKIEPGCVCPMGLYMEANKCVNITECQKCVINGTEYQPSEPIPSSDSCKYCECSDGEMVCSRRCEIPVCKEGEELSYEGITDICCPKCQPKPTTCTLHTEKRVINDSVTGCVSVGEVEYTFCSGSCGDSNYMPLIVPSGSTEEGFAKTCKCCTGESSSERVISVRCGPQQTLQQAKIKIIDSCSCDICSMTVTEANKANAAPTRR